VYEPDREREPDKVTIVRRTAYIPHILYKQEAAGASLVGLQQIGDYQEWGPGI